MREKNQYFYLNILSEDASFAISNLIAKITYLTINAGPKRCREEYFAKDNSK